MDELKPCPFCGGQNLERRKATSLGQTFFYVQCRDCFASTGWFKPEKKATEAWNRRAANV